MGLEPTKAVVGCWLEAAGALRPSLDVPPVPDEGGFERRHRFREVGVTSTKGVDRLRVAESEPFRDFVRANEML